jgi:hypothetical protein
MLSDSDVWQRKVQLLEAEKEELTRQLQARDATISCLQLKNGVLRRALASAKDQESTNRARRNSCFPAFNRSEATSSDPLSNPVASGVPSRLTDGELHHASQLARKGRRAVKELLEKLSRRDNPQQIGANRAIVLHPDCATYEAEVQRKAEHIRHLLGDHLQGVDLEVRSISSSIS